MRVLEDIAREVEKVSVSGIDPMGQRRVQELAARIRAVAAVPAQPSGEAAFYINPGVIDENGKCTVGLSYSSPTARAPYTLPVYLTPTPAAQPSREAVAVVDDLLAIKLDAQEAGYMYDTTIDFELIDRAVAALSGKPETAGSVS